MRRHTRTHVHAVTVEMPVDLADAAGVADHVSQPLDGQIDSRFTIDAEHLDAAMGLLLAARIHTLTVTQPSLDALFLSTYDGEAAPLDAAERGSRKRRDDERDRPPGHARYPVAHAPSGHAHLDVRADRDDVARPASGRHLHHARTDHSYAQAVTAGDALVAINGRVEGIDSPAGSSRTNSGSWRPSSSHSSGSASLQDHSARRSVRATRDGPRGPGRAPRPGAGGSPAASAAIFVTAVAFALGLVAFGVPAKGAILSPRPSARSPSCSPGSRWSLPRSPCTPGASRWVCRSRGRLRPTRRRRRDRHVDHLARTARRAEKAAPFGPTRWWTLLIPWSSVGYSPRPPSSLRGVETSAAPPSVAAGVRRGPRRGCATRSGWRPTSTVRAALGWLAGAGSSPAYGRPRAAVHRRRCRQPGHRRGHRDVRHTTPGWARCRDQAVRGDHRDGNVVQAVSSLRGEESSGRLEVRLSGTLSRTRWLAGTGSAIVIGLIVIVVASSVVLATGMALSLGDAVPIDSILGAGLAFLRPSSSWAHWRSRSSACGQGRSPLPGRPSPSSPSSRSWAGP